MLFLSTIKCLARKIYFTFQKRRYGKSSMMLQIEVDSLCNLLCVKAVQGKNCWTTKSNLCLGLLFLVTARISIRLKDLKLCRKGRVRNLMVTMKILCFIYRFQEASFFFCLERRRTTCVWALGHFGLAQCVQASTTHKAQQCKHFTIFYSRHTLVLLWSQTRQLF